MPRFAPYGYNYEKWTIHIPFTTYLSQTAAQASLRISQAIRQSFELVAVEIAPTIVATGAGASRVINVRKGGITGTIVGTITALLADGATLGTMKAGTVTVTTATNKFSDVGATPDTLTVELPTGGTVFSAGEFDLILSIRSLNQRAA